MSYDYNYTDPSETGGLPLGQPWERVAAKELADIGHYLTHGLFLHAADFAERLRQSADAIEDTILARIPNYETANRSQFNLPSSERLPTPTAAPLASTRPKPTDEVTMFNAIDYEILPDGTCSYCGHPAELIGLPDGDVTCSDRCIHCDEYNAEALAEMETMFPPQDQL